MDNYSISKYFRYDILINEEENFKTKICSNCSNIISPNLYFKKYLFSKCRYKKVEGMTININKLDVINFLRGNIHNFTEEIINIKEHVGNLNVFKDDNVRVNYKGLKKEVVVHIQRCRKDQK